MEDSVIGFQNLQKIIWSDLDAVFSGSQGIGRYIIISVTPYNYVLLCKVLTFQPTISLHASYRLTQIGFNCAKFVPISEEKKTAKSI